MDNLTSSNDVRNMSTDDVISRFEGAFKSMMVKTQSSHDKMIKFITDLSQNILKFDTGLNRLLNSYENIKTTHQKISTKRDIYESELESKSKELKEAIKQKEETQRQLKECGDTILNLKNAISANLQTINTLKSDLARENDRYAEMNEKFNHEADERLSVLKKSNIVLETQINELTRQKNDLEKEKIDMNSNINNLNGEISKLKDELTKCNETITTCVNEKNKLLVVINEYATQINTFIENSKDDDVYLNQQEILANIQAKIEAITTALEGEQMSNNPQSGGKHSLHRGAQGSRRRKRQKGGFTYSTTFKRKRITPHTSRGKVSKYQRRNKRTSFRTRSRSRSRSRTRTYSTSTRSN